MKTMNTMKQNVKFATLTIAMLGIIACKDGKKSETATPSAEDVPQQSVDIDETMTMNDQQDEKAEKVLRHYFTLKDALVSTDNAIAKSAGAELASALKDLDASTYPISQQDEMKDILVDAIEHAEHIAESDMGHQREHFKILSQDMVDMVAITGTSNTLYEQYCPMYDNNKGGAWLSMTEDIKNPYFGEKMLTCGKVQRTIN